MSDIFELLKELDIKYPDEKIKFKIANFDTLVKLYDSLLIEKEKLEKALDKACVILSHEDIYPCDCGEDVSYCKYCPNCGLMIKEKDKDEN